MAVATIQANINTFPNGNDNTQRRQVVYGTCSIIGASPSYVQGGVRVNFNNLEFIKAQTMLPQWCEFDSLNNTGWQYEFAPLGAQITNIALTTNVVTITCKNNLAAGDIVLLSGITTATFLNGQTLTVLAGSLSATQFTANFTHANYGSAGDTGYVLPTLYASGLPYQGNLMIFESAATVTPPNPLAELATGALPTSITGNSTTNADVIGFKAEFIRAL
jgi:hypothetical protein